MNLRTRLASKFSAVSLTAVAFGLTACGGSDSHANAPSNAQATAPADMSGSSTATSGPSGPQGTSASNTGMPATGTSAAGAGMGGRTTGTMSNTKTDVVGSTNAMGGTADASTLEDSQIAAVVAAINDGEIQQGQLAATKATLPAVKSFAHHMVTAHRTMQTKDTTVLSKAQITPSDNSLSNQLKTEAQSQLSDLQSLKGKDFDRQYVDDQVKGHTKALQLIDTVIVNVKSAELKADLQAARPQVEEHLKAAEKLQQQLESAASGTMGATTGAAGKSATVHTGSGASTTTMP